MPLKIYFSKSIKKQPWQRKTWKRCSFEEFNKQCIKRRAREGYILTHKTISGQYKNSVFDD